MRLRCLIVVLFIVASFGFTACGDGNDKTTHSDADAKYVAAVMVSERVSAQVGELLHNSAIDQQVQDLGAAIARSQSRYADRAEDLLTGWGVAIPDVDIYEASNPLKMANGSLDRNGLEVLLKRHDAIIVASTAEIAAGENSATKKLARDLLAARNAEKGQIEALLNAT